MSRLLIRIFLVASVLGLGILGFVRLAAMKKPPDLKEAVEHALAVEGMRVRFDEYTVTLEGYGTVRSVQRVAVAPEVGGKVDFLRYPFETGTIVEGGELLFRIDPRVYLLKQQVAEAERKVLEAQIARIRQQQENDSERRRILQRSLEIASSRYDRLRTLYKNKEVGTLSEVESAESALITQENQLALLDNALALYPCQINELEASLSRVQVQSDQAALDLEKTEVCAPFSGRLTAVNIEQGQLFSPGQQVCILVDDEHLEIPISLDSLKVQQWLLQQGSSGESSSGRWYKPPEEIRCLLHWTESPELFSWPGKLERIERINQETRTMTVVVIPDPQGAKESPSGLSLAEGMFCTAQIPSFHKSRCIRIPLAGVTHERTVYVSKENRLQTRKVSLIHENETYAFVQGGLADGEIVITTRLVNPLEGSLLEVSLPSTEERE
ncbi:MAG: hypothetical protein KJ645_11100 [Planctomycetes bacterium]|nr:hypothetical protein [Planctomycetota bacterium]